MGSDGQGDGAGAQDGAAPKAARPKRKAAAGTAPQPAEVAVRAEDAPAKDPGAAEPSPADSTTIRPVAPDKKAPDAAASESLAAKPDATPTGAQAGDGQGNTPTPDGDEGRAQPAKKRGVFGRFKREKAASTVGKEMQPPAMNETFNANDKPRHWELTVNARAMTYVGADKQLDTFFAVSVRPENEKTRARVQLLSEYTPAYVLARNERFALETPVELYDRKKFSLSYHQLQKYVLQVDMWRVSPWTFNQFYGQSRVCLWDICKRNPNMSIKLREKLTKKDEAEKKKMKRPISDVAVFECTVNLEEIFDFHLWLANWRFEYEQFHPEVEERLHEKMSLTFIIPKNCYSDPLRKKNCRVFRTIWRGGRGQSADGQEEETKFLWLGIGKTPFIFRGTRTSLTNQFFIVNVHSGKPLLGGAMPLSSIGSSLMGLTSVLTISVFKGRVKSLSTQEEYFNVGTLTGSVKALMCSINEHYVEEIPGGRPEQSKSSLSVTSLLKMRYLVIKVTKCEGLAVADAETFSSDPFLLTVWDNMVQSSPIIEKTTAPVFNHTFYFPVRTFNQKLETPRYQDTALLYELKAKGDIALQVWDDDGSTSADSLGFVRISMRQILANNFKGRRNLRGKVKETATVDEDEEDVRRPNQWYDQEEDVRIFDGAKTELTGCSLPNSQTALIYFEVYFFPDFSEEVAARADQVLKTRAELNVAELWKQKERQFDRESADFARSYAEPFPDSIGAKPCKEDLSGLKSLRRFQCLANHPQTYEWTPLMAYLVKIVTDDSYNSPMMLLHWMNCITYYNPPSQKRTGLIPFGAWKDPQYMLFTRKGPVQDHSLLLCSVLLGSGWDAYVCKGTVWTKESRLADVEEDGEGKKPTTLRLDEPMRLVEHTWVMTRETGGWVTFWEPCTLELYHMPMRWTSAKGKPKPAPKVVKEEEAEEAQEEVMLPQEDTHLAPDMAVVGEDVENLPTIGAVSRIPKAKEKAKAPSRDKLRQEQIAQREKLPTAPKAELLNMDEKSGTFVDWLPYDSIDVVFNMDNLWCNRQNHHPACIMYDFEPLSENAPSGWSKLLKDEEERKALPFEYINTDVFIDPALKPEKLTGLELETVNEMEENMRLYRQKRGHDTWWDKSPELLAQLTTFLDIHERMKTIDMDLCPIWSKKKEDLTVYEKYLIERLKFGNCAKPWNKYGTPFMQTESMGAKKYANCRKQQARAYEELMEMVKSFVDKRKLFPTKKGKVFTGFPVHFCTVDKHEIRRYLMHLPEYKRLLERTEEGLDFTIHCKIYGFLGGVQSCWLYFGVQGQQEDEKLPD